MMVLLFSLMYFSSVRPDTVFSMFSFLSCVEQDSFCFCLR